MLFCCSLRKLVKLTSEGSTGNILAKLLISVPILSSIPFTPTQVLKEQESELGLVFCIKPRLFFLFYLGQRKQHRDRGRLTRQCYCFIVCKLAGDRRKTEVRQESEMRKIGKMEKKNLRNTHVRIKPDYLKQCF